MYFKLFEPMDRRKNIRRRPKVNYAALSLCKLPVLPAGSRTLQQALAQLVKKFLRAFFAKLLPELQNQILYHDFAILPLLRVI